MANESMADFLEALEEGANLLDRLNKAHPDLADNFTHETVEEFRRTHVFLHESKEPNSHISTIKQAPVETSVDTDQQDQKLIKTTQELLAIHGFDDVLDILQTKHGITLNLVQLVNLVGNSAYITALRREALEFQSNAISLPQMAQLWADFGRPPIGDTAWTASTVSRILE